MRRSLVVDKVWRNRTVLFKERLEVYHQKTSPLIGYYDDQGVLRRLDGTRNPTEVHDHIRAVIATLRLEENV